MLFAIVFENEKGQQKNNGGCYVSKADNFDEAVENILKAVPLQFRSTEYIYPKMDSACMQLSDTVVRVLY